ncbi:MAG: methionyl-tRNA formyltransferase [Chlamydiia bacterium]|nr:methionyl-tRNA formyltransferase [Chlamydiia bacterium]
MRIVFFGTPKFAANILKVLSEANFDICGIISKPDRPVGRSQKMQPTPVKLVAQSLLPDVPFYQPEKVSQEAFAPTLHALNADLFVVVAYGEILKQHVLDMPKKGCINVHASLLPHYRGAAPIQRAVIAGEKESGVSIMHLVKEMDAGDIILKEALPIPIDMTAGELEEGLCQLGAKLLTEALRHIDNGTAQRTPQNHQEATLAPKVSREECQINWQQEALTVHNLIRGVNPAPGAWCEVYVDGAKKQLKIHRTKALSGSIEEEVRDKGHWIIPCSSGSLELLEVQLEGKKRMSGPELLRGVPQLNLGVS